MTASDILCPSLYLFLRRFGCQTLARALYPGPRHTSNQFLSTSGSATGRAQRASARNVTTIPSPSDALASDGIVAEPLIHSIPDSDPLAMPVDSETSSISRSNSGQNLAESSSSAPNGKVRGTRKGKGKQADKTLIRVKEEEMAPPSLSPDPAPVGLVGFI